MIKQQENYDPKRADKRAEKTCPEGGDHFISPMLTYGGDQVAGVILNFGEYRRIKDVRGSLEGSLSCQRLIFVCR